MYSSSRRTFLAQSSLAVASTAFGWSRTARAITLPTHSRRSILSHGPDLVDGATLRTLAQRGVDAAKSAGATYADIRLNDARTLDMLSDRRGPLSTMFVELNFGIRVLVDGMWAFASGTELTPDAIALAARSAVTTARGLSTMGGARQELTPVPVVTGEWSMPVAQDVFDTSPDELAKLFGAYWQAIDHVFAADLTNSHVNWTKESRVFASTEGSLVTQHLTARNVGITVGVHALDRKEATRLPVVGLDMERVGLDGLTGADVQERIKETAEECKRLTRYPEASADVGRYPAVLDGGAIGSIFGATIAQGLGMDRVLGNDADNVGTSFLAPVDAVLGQQQFSPLLNVTADRAPPHFGAAKWDDEGVATETFPVITKGAVVDYFTTRSTAPALASWYAKQGRPVTSRGSAIAWSAALAPKGCASHLTIASGTTGKTLDNLMKEMGTGLLLRGSDFAVSDQQVSGGAFGPYMMYEVKQGQITRRLRGGLMQFGTKSLWNGLATLGDASTVISEVNRSYIGETWIAKLLPVAAPAAHMRQVDIIQTGRILL